VQVSYILRLGDGLSWKPMKVKLNFGLSLFSVILMAMTLCNNYTRGSVDYSLLLESIASHRGNNSLLLHMLAQHSISNTAIFVQHNHHELSDCLLPPIFYSNCFLMGKLVYRLVSHSSTMFQ
jgi:hypothetical protein